MDVSALDNLMIISAMRMKQKVQKAKKNKRRDNVISTLLFIKPSFPKNLHISDYVYD
jgi:hypothetical protein